MRRMLLCLLLVALLIPMAAHGEAMQRATDALFDALMPLSIGKAVDETSFAEEGHFMSAILGWHDADFRYWQGITYDMQAEAMVTWDDLFEDGDAAATHLEAIAAGAASANAYAEHNEVSPMPRNNFAVDMGQLTVYYPPTRLSYFSGRAGAYSFFAYEMEGLLKPGVPLAIGDTADAKTALEAALSSGALPHLPEACRLGAPMADAAAALDLVDVPDLTHDAAMWHFEAPQMRGVTLLSASDDDDKTSAVINGIQAVRLDFSGLCTGKATKDECIAALGTPDEVRTQAAADAYSRLPAGETLVWQGAENTLSMHFADSILHSVILQTQ